MDDMLFEILDNPNASIPAAMEKCEKRFRSLMDKLGGVEKLKPIYWRALEFEPPQAPPPAPPSDASDGEVSARFLVLCAMCYVICAVCCVLCHLCYVLCPTSYVLCPMCSVLLVFLVEVENLFITLLRYFTK